MVKKVNFTEMYLIPRELYLKVIKSTCNSDEDMGSSPGLFSSEALEKTPPGYPPTTPSINPSSTPSEDFYQTRSTRFSESEQDRESIKTPSYNYYSGYTTPRSNLNEGESGQGEWQDPSFFSGYSSPKSHPSYQQQEPMEEEDQSETPPPPPQPGPSAAFYEFMDKLRKAFPSSQDRTLPEDNLPSASSTPSRRSSSSSSSSSGKNRKRYEPPQNYPFFDQNFAREKVRVTPPESTKGGEQGVTPPPPYPEFDKAFSREEFVFKKPAPKAQKRSISSSNSSISTKKPKSDSQKNKSEETRGARGGPPSPNTSTSSSSSKRRQSSRKEVVNNHISRIIAASDNDCYTIMDVRPGWDKKELDGQFKTLRKLIHPDKCKHPDATLAFQKLQNAYNECVKRQKETEDELREENQRQANFRKAKEKADQQKYKEYYNKQQQQFSTQNKKPKYKGPPTTSYSSPLRPPPSAAPFNRGSRGGYFFGSGINTWLKL